MFLHLVSLSCEEWFWWIYMITIHIGPNILLMISILHSKNVIQDLCTKNRKSVQWRTTNPQITKQYIIMSITILLSIILFTLSSIQALNLWSYFSEYCTLLSNLATVLWMLSKLFMYLVFLYRLHLVYHGSQFQHNTSKLIFVAIITIILTINNIICSILFTEISITQFDNMQYAQICDTYYPLYIAFIVGTSDTLICCYFLYSFIKPIKILINYEDNNKEQIKELLDLGIKSFILTTFSSISTLIFVLFVLLTNSVILSTFDININCICIILMTPYYSDQKYYNKLCCLCIKCTKNIIGYNDDKVANIKINSNTPSILTTQHAVNIDPETPPSTYITYITPTQSVMDVIVDELPQNQL